MKRVYHLLSIEFSIKFDSQWLMLKVYFIRLVNNYFSALIWLSSSQLSLQNYSEMNCISFYDKWSCQFDVTARKRCRVSTYMSLPYFLLQLEIYKAICCVIISTYATSFSLRLNIIAVWLKRIYIKQFPTSAIATANC